MFVEAALIAVVAAAPGDDAVEASRRFYALVDRRPRAACRAYLTPRARKQWDNFDGTQCKQEHVTGSDLRRSFHVDSVPSRRVVRVAVQALDVPHCGGELVPENVNTVVFRGGRWRIARFGAGGACVPSDGR